MKRNDMKLARKEAAQLISQGNTIQYVAKAYDRSTSWVTQACIEFGVPRPNKGCPTRINTYKIIRKLMSGIKIQTIAIEFHTSRQYVEQIRDKCVEVGII